MRFPSLKKKTSLAHFLFSVSLCAISVHACFQVALHQAASAKPGRRGPPGQPDAEQWGTSWKTARIALGA